MLRSPLPKGILGDPHLTHMIDSSVPSRRDLRRSESVRPAKLNTRSAVALAAGIVRIWRAMTVMRGKRSRPTSLHQTRTSTARSLPLGVYPTHHGVSPHTHTSRCLLPCWQPLLQTPIHHTSIFLTFHSYFLFLYYSPQFLDLQIFHTLHTLKHLAS